MQLEGPPRSPPRRRYSVDGVPVKIPEPLLPPSVTPVAIEFQREMMKLPESPGYEPKPPMVA